jgi:diguanylate cyclase (GGDEF)-like protein
MFVYFQNIESEKQKELQAQTDKMTGLYNKDTTECLVRQALSGSGGGKNLFAFIILDIDNFKSINDSCGHAVGDLAITEFASIIRQNVRKGDILGRVGGDEFAAFVPIPSIEWAEKKVSELSKALHGSHSAEGKTYGLSASIGVSFAPKDGEDFETLYKNADAALYRIKAMGKNGYALFSK